MNDSAHGLTPPSQQSAAEQGQTCPACSVDAVSAQMHALKSHVINCIRVLGGAQTRHAESAKNMITSIQDSAALHTVVELQGCSVEFEILAHELDILWPHVILRQRPGLPACLDNSHRNAVFCAKHTTLLGSSFTQTASLDSSEAAPCAAVDPQAQSECQSCKAESLQLQYKRIKQNVVDYIKEKASHAMTSAMQRTSDYPGVEALGRELGVRAVRHLEFIAETLEHNWSELSDFTMQVMTGEAQGIIPVKDEYPAQNGEYSTVTGAANEPFKKLSRWNAVRNLLLFR